MFLNAIATRAGLATAVAAVTLVGVSGPASATPSRAATAVSTTAAADVAAQPSRLPGCDGGYVRMAAPWRSGAYIQISTIAHCGRNSTSKQRKGFVDVRLDQYRGLGVWRNKAASRIGIGDGAVTSTRQPRWKCSGGSQLYRNHTYAQITYYDGVTYHFDNSLQRRISC